MNRRELIKQISILTGVAVAGADLFLSGCNNTDQSPAELFNQADINFFDEVAETIIPTTNTPGAKDAEVGKFMASYSGDCYDDAQLKSLREGIDKLNAAAKDKFKDDFIKITPGQRQQLLTQIDEEAKKYNEDNDKQKKDFPPHYFTLMKQMTMLGFFTSKAGCTQVLRYVPVPGKYQGCINYVEGETSWV